MSEAVSDDSDDGAALKRTRTGPAPAASGGAAPPRRLRFSTRGFRSPRSSLPSLSLSPQAGAAGGAAAPAAAGPPARFGELPLSRAPSKRQLKRTMSLVGQATHDASGLNLTEFSMDRVPHVYFTKLVLRNNQLQTLPDELQRLRQLCALDAAHNNFFHVPAPVCLLGALRELNLSNNRLKDVPAELCNLVNLDVLTLSHNSITHEGLPRQLARLAHLRVLDLGHNALEAIPPCIAQLPVLSRLLLPMNRLSRHLPLDDLREMTSLQVLDLAHNFITSLGPIGEMTALTRLDLTANELEVLPDGLVDLPCLTDLCLDDNPRLDGRVCTLLANTRGQEAIKRTTKILSIVRAQKNPAPAAPAPAPPAKRARKPSGYIEMPQAPPLQGRLQWGDDSSDDGGGAEDVDEIEEADDMDDAESASLGAPVAIVERRPSPTRVAQRMRATSSYLNAADLGAAAAAGESEPGAGPAGGAPAPAPAAADLAFGAGQAWELDAADIKVEKRKILGSGQYGTVYKGKYRQKTVAVKLLTALSAQLETLAGQLALAQSQSQSQIFQSQDSVFGDGFGGNDDSNPEEEEASVYDVFFSEIAVYQRLRHPHVVEFLGAYRVDTQLYMVTAFMAKGALRPYLAAHRGRMSVRAKLSVARDIAAGMEYLHGLGLMHRDLKADNVLLDGKLRARINDFGWSKIAATDSQHRHTGLAGDIYIMAPEVVRGVPYGPACDVWSFGVVVWEILNERAPYGHMDDKAHVIGNAYLPLEKAKLPVLTPFNDVALDALAKIVARCWVDQNERPKFCDLCAALDGLLGTLP